MAFRILFLPRRKFIQVEAHTTVLQAGIDSKAGIEHKCGGKGSCGTCKVKINPRSAINAPTRIERLKLLDRQIKGGYRLACQVIIGSDLEVEVPESPLSRVVREKLLEIRGE